MGKHSGVAYSSTEGWYVQAASQHAQPTTPEEVGTGMLVDASKSTSDLKSPIQRKRNTMRAFSTKDKLRLVEWP